MAEPRPPVRLEPDSTDNPNRSGGKRPAGAPTRPMPEPKPGFIVLRGVRTLETVTLLMDDEGGFPAGGLGGWQTMQVGGPDRRGAVFYQAAEGSTAERTIILGPRAERSVLRPWQRLREFGRPTDEGLDEEERAEPEAIQIAGDLLLEGRLWVLQAAEPEGEDALLYDAERTLLQVRAKLTLQEYLPLRDLDVREARSSRDQLGRRKKKYRTTVVRAGDTLASIASRELGDPRKASTLAKLNRIKDPRRIKRGQKIKLP